MAKAEADQLREHAAKREAELKERLDAQMAKLRETKENVTSALQAANEASTAKLVEVEEEHQRASRQHSKENDSLKR